VRARALASAILAVVLCAGPACKQGSSAQASADAAPRMTKRIVRVDPGALERLGIKVEPAGTQAPGHRLHLPGTLDFSYSHYAEVGPLVDGRITSIAAGVGDRVKKGQLLATLLVPALARSQADFVSAQAAAKVAREHAQREASLLDKNLTTAREAQSANADQIKTQADLEASRARLEAIGAGVPRGGTIGGAGRLPLVSTISGTVVRRDAVLGKYMQPNEIAFIVADLSVLWAVIQVHEADLPYMQVGADVDLVLDAQPGQVFKGKLELVEPQVSKTSRAARARVVVPNPDEKLRPGLFVRAAVAIPDTTGSDRLLVPSDAVQTLGESDVVFAELSPGVFEAREVRLARKTAEVSEIAAGLQRGERIAVTGTFLLRNEVIKQ
jgi:membrane fusion protein, heavy metal efflux system